MGVGVGGAGVDVGVHVGVGVSGAGVDVGVVVGVAVGVARTNSRWDSTASITLHAGRTLVPQPRRSDHTFRSAMTRRSAASSGGGKLAPRTIRGGTCDRQSNVSEITAGLSKAFFHRVIGIPLLCGGSSALRPPLTLHCC